MCSARATGVQGLSETWITRAAFVFMCGFILHDVNWWLYYLKLAGNAEWKHRSRIKEARGVDVIPASVPRAQRATNKTRSWVWLTGTHILAKCITGMHCNSLWIKMTVRCIHAGGFPASLLLRWHAFLISDSRCWCKLSTRNTKACITDSSKRNIIVIIVYVHKGAGQQLLAMTVLSMRWYYVQLEHSLPSLFHDTNTDWRFSLCYKQPSKTCTTLRIIYYKRIVKGVQNA